MKMSAANNSTEKSCGRTCVMRGSVPTSARPRSMIWTGAGTPASQMEESKGPERARELQRDQSRASSHPPGRREQHFRQPLVIDPGPVAGKGVRIDVLDPATLDNVRAETYVTPQVDIGPGRGQGDQDGGHGRRRQRDPQERNKRPASERRFMWARAVHG